MAFNLSYLESMLSPSHLTSKFVLDKYEHQVVHIAFNYISGDGFIIFKVVF